MLERTAALLTCAAAEKCLSSVSTNGPNPVLEFFRCPTWFVDTPARINLPPELASALAAAQSSDPLWQEPGTKWLTSSSLKEWIDLLRLEHYDQASTETTLGAILAREAYYAIRPILGVTVRRYLQGFALRNWDKRPFPRWPVDRTADELLEISLAERMKQKGVSQVPFIWFWPKGYKSCALLTHDVETANGLRFCPALMDMDDAEGIKSSFQLIPEQRYKVTEQELQTFRDRGFEINVHDLNHDGHLFRDRRKFFQRAGKINEYGRKFGASGFRAGALYRNQDWFHGLQFAYDMSVPNVAHLDPQHGGCCTIFPYFVGDVLELPVTAIQDYSLFHVLRTYSIDIWRMQMSRIAEHHGLINVITHPDYLIEERAQNTYKELLRYLAELRDHHSVWLAQPHEVAAWWRERAAMELVWDGGQWRIEGRGSERAVIGYLESVDTQIRYRVAGAASVAAKESQGRGR